ncbi:MAG TPA: deoxynucleoside kinase [Herpetosiphonaceae bacterium]
MSAQPVYIVIEGVIGVGKTTLARLLSREWGAATLLEVVEANPFLSDFYADRAKYAFQTETFFVLSRYKQQHDEVPAHLAAGPLISDYHFAKNKLFAGQNLVGDERELFDTLFAALSRQIRVPDLVIYLQAELETLLRRIALRDRPFERNMERAYLEGLSAAYDDFFRTYDEAPLLTIQTDALDVVSDPAALAHVSGLVRARLAGYEQGRMLNGASH